MNRIVEFSEELAYVTVEPGVTQQQLYDFLQARRGVLPIIQRRLQCRCHHAGIGGAGEIARDD